MALNDHDYLTPVVPCDFGSQIVRTYERFAQCTYL